MQVLYVLGRAPCRAAVAVHGFCRGFHAADALPCQQADKLCDVGKHRCCRVGQRRQCGCEGLYNGRRRDRRRPLQIAHGAAHLLRAQNGAFQVFRHFPQGCGYPVKNQGAGHDAAQAGAKTLDAAVCLFRVKRERQHGFAQFAQCRDAFFRHGKQLAEYLHRAFERSYGDGKRDLRKPFRHFFRGVRRNFAPA